MRWKIYIAGVVLFALYILWNYLMYHSKNDAASPFYTNIYKSRKIKGADTGICIAASFVYPLCVLIATVIFKYLLFIPILFPAKRIVIAETLSIQAIVFIALFIYARVLLGKPIFDSDGWVTLFFKVINDAKQGLAKYNRNSKYRRW